MKEIIVTLTGPSCAGKSTLEKMLKQRGFESVVSTTTRKMRDGEVNGESYHFISKSEFRRLEIQGAFVETVFFNGNHYGVTASEVERVFATGKPVVVVVEPSGLKQVRRYAKAKGWDVFSVWINNPDIVIAERFLRRFNSEITSGSALQIYTSRLATMMSKERSWIAEATMDDGLLYERIIPTFDMHNDFQVVGEICEIAKVEVAQKAA